MSIDDVDLVDAALILDELADLLTEELPPLHGTAEARERQQVARACRHGAQLVAAAATGGPSYAAARSYAGGEWRNALLRALVGLDGAVAVAEAAMRRRRLT
jgi:hypothetical protein